MEITKKDIKVALQSALLGAIYPEIRAITFFYNPKIKSFRLRYYMDREPLENDFENVDSVLTEFIATFNFSAFSTAESECVYSLAPIAQLDIMEGMVFCRKEGI